MNATSRRGWSRTELLVVVAMLVALAGLIVPAVQKVRETAERTQCRNNLRQVGIAAYNLHDTVGYLYRNPDSYDPHSGTFQYLLLFYME